MRTIKQLASFKRDLKREAKGQHRAALSRDLVAIVAMLARDEQLAERHRDHALAGKRKDCRDCHIKPDLVLIYRKPDGETLELVHLGSHSELDLWLPSAPYRNVTAFRLHRTVARLAGIAVAATAGGLLQSAGQPSACS
jgi:mRNA interferase YafQ